MRRTTSTTPSREGASGYLPKANSIQQVATAIHAITGRQPDHPFRGIQAADGVQKASSRAAEMMRYRVPRELEILKLVAQGLSNRQIAQELSISENTANNHMRNIIEKLHRGTR